ncbi:MAG: heme exporter protein CcmD [Gordonibacter sp.]|nr:heme exporter protein CcmD [Gordonibacter sp.]
MNPILIEIYSTVFPAAPYVIGAYALIFLALFVFVFVTLRGLKKTEQQMAILEEALAERDTK